MTKTPSTPHLSATVLIIRDGETAPEVLMVKRHYQIDFAAGALVFPGGKTNDEDSSPDWDPYTDGDFGPVQQDARIAAVREAFEESGLLLARHENRRGPGAPLVGPEISEKLAPHRGAVDRREESFLELIRDNGLVLALDSLIHFGHWITPEMMPKRFDTHFYLAPAPADQIAAHDGRETTDAVWLGANDALDMELAGKATIIFPTRMNLVKLARSTSVAEAAERFGAEPIVTVLPQAGKTDAGEPCLFIPEEAGYGQTVELLSRVNV
ncbi:MAG: NUDIX hydrolase [Hyphomonas sp.]